MLSRKIWIGICVFLFLVVIVAFACYRSSIRGPQFYREAIQVDSGQNTVLGEALENDFLNAHNTAIRESNWNMVISDEQLNGWIATHLAKKYARYYPRQIENLCTSFAGNRIRIAFKVKQGWIPLVVTIQADLFMTGDEQNIALRLEKMGTGYIPFPKKQATERISKAMDGSDISILWTTEQGQPLGLMPVQFDLAKKTKRRIIVTHLSIQDRKLIVAGTAADIPE